LDLHPTKKFLETVLNTLNQNKFMDMKITSPVQLFINDRFFCIVNEVEIKYNAPEFKKELIPDNVKLDPGQFTGTVVHIRKPYTQPSEKAIRAKEKNKAGYDKFFSEMVNRVDDPDAHFPIE